MSNSSNDVKQKPVFSYARAAQGSTTSTPTAVSPQLNGKSAPSTNDATANVNGDTSSNEKPAEDASVSQAPPTHSSRSSVSSAVGTTPAWANKGPGVHMPPRTQAAANPNATASVQFGNFANTSNSPQPVQKSPTLAKATPAASGGTAPPPAIQGKDVPQFGSIPSANTASVDAHRLPSHSRSNSNASDFKPSGLSPNPQQFPMGYPIGAQQQFGYQQGQYSPAMPNFRGGRAGASQYQNRGGARNVQGARSNASTPIHNPQQQHAVGSPLASPAMYSNYPVQPQMYANYGGYPQQFGGYTQGQNYQQPPHMSQNYVNPQAGRAPVNYNQQHQYQNPNLSGPIASTMSRSGSAISERPNSSMAPGTPTPSTPGPSAATPSFQTPRKKGSSAIKIVNPNSKEEVVLPKTPVPEVRRENISSPAPKIERPMSSGPPRSSTSTPQMPVETAEQKKAKQDAAKQAILDKIAAAKAADQGEIDRKAEAEKLAKQEADAAEAKLQAAKDQAAKEAKEAEEKARLAAEEEEAAAAAAAKVQAEEAQAAKLAEEKSQREKAEREERARDEKAAEEKANAKAEADKEAAAAEEARKEAANKAATDAKAKESLQQEAATLPEDVSKAEESATLDTIVEPASVGQSSDVIETKAIDSDVTAEASDRTDAGEDSTTSVSDQKKRPANLSVDTGITDEKPQPSAMVTSLLSSKRIQDISAVQYPAGIKAPDASINKAPKDGKFKYDKEFLLQFQKVYTDKPNFEWDDKIKSAMGDSDGKSSKGMGGRSASNRANASPFSGLPAFNPKPLKSSEDRFKQAEKMRAAGIDPAAALGGAGGQTFERGSNFKPTMSRKDSLNPNSPRTESKRGGKGGRAPSNRPEKPQVGAPTIAPEDVKPLANSGNRWTPKRAAEAEPLPGATESTAIAPDVVQRKVKGLLNKLTLDNFDRITDQILEIAGQSKEENDGRTLRQVIALTFEKATDEAHFSNMYARFCRKVMECTSDDVKDEGITDKHGNQVVGGTLFRKYLLSRCQEDFERGWKTDLPPKPDGEPQNEEAAMLSDEYYIAAAAKRRGLGLVRFIGELFLLQMLNERIMQECIRKLLANVTDPEEEEVESLSKLVETVGSALDSTARGHEIMDVYMGRMEQLTSCTSLSSRIKFMVLDVIDLRKAGWVGSKTDKGPKTIQEIHDEAAKAAALKETQRGSSHRGGGLGGGRPDFGRGDVRNMSRRQESHGPTLTTGADGWSTLKASAREPPARAGDLTKFGQFGDKRTISRQGTFGPGGNLSQTTRTNSNQISRNPSHSAGQSREDSRSSQLPTNAFAVLEGDSGEHVEEPEAVGAQDTASARPRLNLLPKGATDGSEPVTEVPSKSTETDETTGDVQSATAEEAEDIPMPGDE